MMISEEQARAAAQLLSTHAAADAAHDVPDVSPEVLAAALAVVRETPDTRPGRIDEARQYLENEAGDSRRVASMMIQRIISDSLR